MLIIKVGEHMCKTLCTRAWRTGLVEEDVLKEPDAQGVQLSVLLPNYRIHILKLNSRK